MIDLEGKSVLVVDDEKEYVDLISEEFADFGCTIYKAYNGEEALEILKKFTTIELVISDMRMPKMDGKELLIRLKEITLFTPVIIFITGQSSIKSIEAYHLGADSILSKPFKMPHLIETAKRLLTPFDQRLSISLRPADQPPLPLEKGHSPHLGRGGVSFCTSTDKLKLGQEISFELEDENDKSRKLEGQGIIRWITKSILQSYKACIGVEFFYLTPDSRNIVLEEVLEKKCTAYIPISTCASMKNYDAE